ncbi:MAG TPA: hypothetical protein VF682_02985 [Pseudomonas sp.]|jgi:hypothetical protein
MNDTFSNNGSSNETKETNKATPDTPSPTPLNAPELLDISHDLKAPFLPNLESDVISHEQVHIGVGIHLAGSALMLPGDELVFYWGVNSSSTTLLLNNITSSSTVRVLCITYHFIEVPQYGVVDLYFEVYRDQYLIGTSPALMVTVNRNTSVTPRQRQRKRSINRKLSRKPKDKRF